MFYTIVFKKNYLTFQDPHFYGYQRLIYPCLLINWKLKEIWVLEQEANTLAVVFTRYNTHWEILKRWQKHVYEIGMQFLSKISEFYLNNYGNLSYMKKKCGKTQGYATEMMIFVICALETPKHR